MRLKEYLESENIRPEAFGARIDRSAASVSRLCAFKQNPSGDVVLSIYVASGGKVMPNDLFLLPELDGEGRVVARAAGEAA